jgi:SPP1 family predicted phage head-tail adaptor
MINAGEYNKRISIYAVTEQEDNAGFKTKTKSIILNAWAKVKTTKGFTLIQSNTDFEQAHTNFTIRYPKKEITRDMLIEYNGKTYTIEYLNNIDENNVELEIQAKVVVK